MNRHIIIIDDSPTIRLSVEYAIRSLGNPIEHAENGRDAMKKISSIKDRGGDLALCICDINMPEMDGISFLKEFRKTDRFTPVIVLTTESQEDKIKAGRESGASGWIVKPFKPQDLVRVVERFVKH